MSTASERSDAHDEEPAGEAPAVARHPLGIGSKFAISADGRLQGRPLSSALSEATGAIQGVSPFLGPVAANGPSTDTISDAIMLSRGPRRRDTHTKLYSIFDESELASGRGEIEQNALATPVSSFHFGEAPAAAPPAAAPTTGPLLTASNSDPTLSSLDGEVARQPGPRREPRVEREESLKREKPKNEEQIKREKHLLAQIKELERQLEKEKLRKKEQAKANKPQQRRRRLIVCTRWLPYGLTRDKSGRLQVQDSLAGSRSSKLASYESVLQRLDVTWVGCPSEEIAPEELEVAREEFASRQCVPIVLPPDRAERAEVLSAEVRSCALTSSACAPPCLHVLRCVCRQVLWPLFHYIPLSMLESDTDMIHMRWGEYCQLNQAFADEINKAGLACAMWVFRSAPLSSGLVVQGCPLAPPAGRAARSSLYSSPPSLQWCKKSDVILVHDYHLMLLPAILRESQPKNKIGWFLHTPFPSAAISQTLPLRTEILRGVLAANLVGFQAGGPPLHGLLRASSVSEGQPGPPPVPASPSHAWAALAAQVTRHSGADLRLRPSLYERVLARDGDRHQRRVQVYP